MNLSRNRSKYYIVKILLTFLLVFLLYSLTVTTALAGSDYIAYGENLYIYATISYVLIILLIFLEKRELERFHIDSVCLGLIALSCLIRPNLAIPGEIFFRSLFTILGAVVIVVGLTNRNAIRKTKGISIIFAIGLGLFTLILVVAIEASQSAKWLTPLYSEYGNLYTFIQTLIFQLSFVTVVEEVVFRGFLIGYLRSSGFDDRKALALSALLFWFMHYRQLAHPISFFITVPIITISLSYIINRTKQLSSTILLHTMLNVCLPLILNLLLN